MRYRFVTCDVFTDRRFGGNQLAVLPEAAGLSDAQMQQIAREFNFSETTFVLPAENGHTRHVRIFTPTMEVPFAGHPNIGTAFVLAGEGAFGSLASPASVTFEEKAGLVVIAIERENGAIWCELAAPQRVSLGQTIPASTLAPAVSLSPDDIVTTTHAPQVASVGLPFLMAELKDRGTLSRARLNMSGFDALISAGVPPDVHLYVRTAGGKASAAGEGRDEFDIRARMFAPLDGVVEDPATGSANCALAGLLGHYDAAPDGVFRWRIAQGVEMGRPSVLDARAEKKDGVVVATYVGGGAVLVSEGLIEAG
jgi:trans-2,3-dihydro-3-hydroxyanthranilate isomerase